MLPCDLRESEIRSLFVVFVKKDQIKQETIYYNILVIGTRVPIWIYFRPVFEAQIKIKLTTIV
jgi:hypothetical protein